MFIEKNGFVEQLGLQIKLERIRNKLKQVELADKLGCSANTISGWEKGSRCPSFWFVKKMEKIFNKNFQLEL